MMPHREYVRLLEERGVELKLNAEATSVVIAAHNKAAITDNMRNYVRKYKESIVSYLATGKDIDAPTEPVQAKHIQPCLFNDEAAQQNDEVFNNPPYSGNSTHKVVPTTQAPYNFTPRNYSKPFPRYELIEENGAKKLVVVGMWSAQIDSQEVQ